MALGVNSEQKTCIEHFQQRSGLNDPGSLCLSDLGKNTEAFCCVIDWRVVDYRALLSECVDRQGRHSSDVLWTSVGQIRGVRII